MNTNANTTGTVVTPVEVDFADTDFADTDFADTDFADTETPAAQEVVVPNGSTLQIPNMMPDLKPLPLGSSSYDHFAGTGRGKEKLAASGVAPLVAMTRGYRTFDFETIPGFVRYTLKSTMASTAAKDLKKATSDGCALLMPWYSATDVSTAARDGLHPDMTTFQTRPTNPKVDSNGKKDKYRGATGAGSVLDVHPVTPLSYLEDAQTVLFAEGLLKADSALTAYLLENGASEEDLKNQFKGDHEAARKSMRALLEAVPVEKRVLIVALVGVGNWHNSAADFNAINVRGKKVLIGFDGDTAINRQVNLQARDLGAFMERRKADEVQFLTVPMVDGDPKTGLDDYFAVGNRFKTIDDMAGDLPPTPAPKVRSEEIELPTVDFEEGITYESRMVEDPMTGDQIRKNVVLTEAAVRITSITSKRGIFMDSQVNVVISGVATWRETRAGVVEVRKANFANKPLSWLEASTVMPNTVVSRLTDGKAAGVKVSPRAGRTTVNAWLATMQEAGSHSAKVGTTGLWTAEDGTFGYLTSDGLLHADGLDPAVRSETFSGKVELDYLDENVSSAQKIDEAWKVYLESKDELNPAHRGLHETFTGMAIAAALGLQPMGGLLIFCKRRSGKSAMLRLMGGWTGPEGHDAPTIMLQNTTKAALSRKFQAISNQLITVDDAMDSGSAKAFEEQGQFLTMAARASYEPKAAMETLRQSVTGEYDLAVRTRDQVMGVIIAGENLDVFDFKDSTLDRTITVQTSDAEPLLARQGTILGAIEKQKSSRAQSILLAAVLTQNLRTMDARMDPDVALHAHMKELEKEAYGHMAAADGNIDFRSLEFLAPVLAGYASLLSAVGAAKRLLAEADLDDGRDYNAEATEVDDLYYDAAEELADLWRRHQARVGVKSDKPYDRLFQTIADSLTAKTMRLATPKVEDRRNGSYEIPTSCRLVGRLRKDGNIAIMPTALVTALSMSGAKGFDTTAKLKVALGEALIKERHTETIEGDAGSSRYLINGDVFRAATGWGVAEPAAVVKPVKSKPELATVTNINEARAGKDLAEASGW